MSFVKFISAVIILWIIGVVICRFFALDSTRGLENQLIIGTASGYAPFVSINQRGEYEGFDIDVVKELAQRMNKELVIKDCGSMVPLMLSLQNGSVDLLIWALEINQSRLREMDMVQYQGDGVTTYSLLFWNNIPAGIQSFDDVKVRAMNNNGVVICCEPGSTQEKFLDQFSCVVKKPMEKVVDMVLDIKYGKSYAALVESALMKNLTDKNPELKALAVPLNEQWRSYGNGICIKKGNAILLKQVKSAIDGMKADGTLRRLEDKWQLSGDDQ